jgi:hypothetical protein
VIHQEAETFRRERLSLVEVMSADFLRAQLRLHMADQQLLNVAAAVDLNDFVQAV